MDDYKKLFMDISDQNIKNALRNVNVIKTVSTITTALSQPSLLSSPSLR